MVNYLMLTIDEDKLIVYDHQDYRGIVYFNEADGSLHTEAFHSNKVTGKAEFAKREISVIEYNNSAVYEALIDICMHYCDVNLAFPTSAPSWYVFSNVITDFNKIIKNKLSK